MSVPSFSFSWERTAMLSHRDASLADDIRGASLCFHPAGKVLGQFVWMYWTPLGGSHPRDLKGKHLEGRASFWQLRVDLFLFRASRIILPPRGGDGSITRRPRGASKLHRKWSLWRRCHHRVWDFPGKGSDSQLFTHSDVCSSVSACVNFSITSGNLAIFNSVTLRVT